MKTPSPARESSLPPLIAIVGPTAVGKTSLSIRLAEGVGGEIVSADSRQVYRLMDVGTAKATPGEQARVPHHLIDVVDPDETLGLAQFQAMAYAAIDGILARGAVPWSGVSGDIGNYSLVSDNHNALYTNVQGLARYLHQTQIRFYERHVMLFSFYAG